MPAALCFDTSHVDSYVNRKVRGLPGHAGHPQSLDPRLNAEDVQFPPMGTYHVAATLKEHGHAVEVSKWHDHGIAAGAWKTRCRGKKPHVIGFSILHANRWGGIEIAHIAKRLDPRVTVVFCCPGISGIGMLRQKARRYEASAEILSKGLSHSPEAEHLLTGLAVSRMRLGRFQEAFRLLARCPEQAETKRLAVACRIAMGRS